MNAHSYIFNVERFYVIHETFIALSLFSFSFCSSTLILFFLQLPLFFFPLLRLIDCVHLIGELIHFPLLVVVFGLGFLLYKVVAHVPVHLHALGVRRDLSALCCFELALLIDL
jgi:hypothetical protein